MSGRRIQALTAVQKAESLEPTWLSIKRAAAIVRYAAALSPYADIAHVAYPNPVEARLVKIDDESAESLEDALERIESVLASQNPLAIDSTWKLAILANLPARYAEAGEFARGLLARSPADAGVLAWALTRGLDFDRALSRATLTKRYEDGLMRASTRSYFSLSWLVREAAPGTRGRQATSGGLAWSPHWISNRPKPQE